jgi:hypothetical protein
VKISAKLVGSVLLIFVAAFGGLAYLADRSARSALVSQAAQALEVARRSRAEGLTTYFNSAYEGLAAAAGGVTPGREGVIAHVRGRIDLVDRTLLAGEA